MNADDVTLHTIGMPAQVPHAAIPPAQQQGHTQQANTTTQAHGGGAVIRSVMGSVIHVLEAVNRYDDIKREMHELEDKLRDLLRVDLLIFPGDISGEHPCLRVTWQELLDV